MLHRNWPNLDTTRSLRPWLFGVAFRVVRTHRRRRAREAPHADLDPEDRAPTPEVWLQGQESLALLSAGPSTCPRVAAIRRRQARPRRARRHRDRARAVPDEVRRLRQALQGTQGAGRRRSAVAEGRAVEMKRRASDLEPELEALLTPRKIQGQLPPELRARVLARARATLVGDAIPPVPPLHVRPTRGALRRRLLPIAIRGVVRDCRRRDRRRGGDPRPTCSNGPGLAGELASRRCPRSRMSTALRRRRPHPLPNVNRPERRTRHMPIPRLIRSPPSWISFSALMPRTRDTSSRSR